MTSLDFVAVGPQRTGTTWMHEVFEPHPQLCLPRHVKETMFFDRYYQKGSGWYEAHFKHGTAGQIRGEFGPTYFDCPDAPARIHAMNPICKIIVNVRNPIDRALSLYRHHLTRGRLRGTFREAFDTHPRILDSGRYSVHIPRWINQFGSERIHYVALDDIYERPAVLTGGVCDFLGISYDVDLDWSKSKVGAPNVPWSRRLAGAAVKTSNWLHGKRLHWLVHTAKRWRIQKLFLAGATHPLPQLTGEEREELLKVYSDDIAYLEELLDRSFENWRAAA